MSHFGEDLRLFLTVIAGQQYSELQKIPVPVALDMERRFFEIVDEIFKGFTAKSPSNVKGRIEALGPPSNWIK